MLTPEEAARRLDSLKDPEWRNAAAQRVGKLPRGLRDMAEAFVAPDPHHQWDASGRMFRNQRHLSAARELDGLSAKDRAQVMAALHPGLGAALARWWTDAQGRPYLRQWDRKAFRAPGAPGLTVDGRAGDLVTLLQLTGPYEADPVWLAIWGGHLAAQRGVSLEASSAMGGLLASAIDIGGEAGEETLAALTEVTNGEHPAGIMGQHVIVALLGASRPAGWELIERLLLAAQLQEGLRQSILEAADEGHPAAFDRMLALVLDKKLLRFASSVRAVGVWLGFGASVADIPAVEARVRALAGYRSSEAERLAALASPDPWDAYVALCAGGMRDVLATVPEARQLADAASPDLRAAALRYAAETRLNRGQQLIAAALDDPDIRAASFAASLLTDDGFAEAGTFDALARLIERSPGTASEASGLGIQQAPVTISQAGPAGMLARALGDRPVSALLPWLPSMDAHGRATVAALMVGEYRYGYQRRESQELTAELRPVVISLLSDRSSHVRSIAIRALTKTRLAPAEAPAIEALLTRAATDIRRGALTLLTSLPPAAARESAARLDASADKRQREAGAELLREIGGGDPASTAAAGSAPVVARAAVVAGTDTVAEAAVVAASPAAPSIEDLHVTLAGDRTPPASPRILKLSAKPGDRAAAVLAALGDLAHEHRDVTVTISTWQGGKEMLLGDVKYFPSPFHRVRPAGHPDTVDDGGPLVAPMVLGEVFRDWWDSRPDALRGGDEGLDALRAYVLAMSGANEPRVPPLLRALPAPAGEGWWRKLMGELTGDAPKGVHHPALVDHVVTCLVAEHANGHVINECLDALEATLARVPRKVLVAVPEEEPRQFYSFGHYRQLPRGDWRHRLSQHPWLTLLSSLLHARPALFTPAQASRWYRLMRWVEQPHPNAHPLPVSDPLLATAHAAGAASDDDVTVTFLRPGNRLFKDLTRHWRAQHADRYPALIPIADRVRDAVVAVETRRGDLPTPTSRTASTISSVHGVATVAWLLASLGATQLARGWSHGSDSKDAVLSHLVRVSFPSVGETGSDLKAVAKAAGVSDARLVDLALYAPQWALPVEEALGWPGLAAGVLWLHAHTKDRQWSVDQELRDSWAAMTAERTALGGDDLVDGAVDVEWFRQVYAALGAKRWAVVYKAAKHASGGNGHRRAQVFAEAMLGQADEAVLTERITGKRSQDAVRALGLLPLPGDEAGRRAAAQARYAVLREFERGTRAFGAQRQASEKTAVRIGIENLARTAGYPDPLRFTWAVEAREAGDLADGPVTVTAADVSLTLSIDAEGVPDLTVSRGGKPLKSVPAALKKDPGIVALQARKIALARQATRVRQSLEAAMVAQDAFTAADLADLRRHPVVAPMLRQLVWVEQDGRTRLLDDGTRYDGLMRIAHPVDLVADGSWVAWQQRLFADARRQPFKQVFRELYAKTAQELADSPVSRRYAGHQLQPRQALALLGNRGWVTSHESGEATRVFHGHGLAARVTFDNGFLTAAEADLPSVDGAYFSKRGEWLAQPLDSVPDVVFSEAMRDLDLVVSVAHAGGVDPEATASTTQMRAALIRETARLLKLTNIEFAGASHAIITGRLGEYSLHLGSGTVHRRPGGAVCIIPVGSQHRGRLFLPFADDDPKTAEIVSKALLLARDHEIKDPTILQQLRD